MTRPPLGLAAALLALTAPAAVAQKEHGFDNRKGSGQPYLTPAETVAKFTVPPEFEVKLFAGEPACVNPVAFSIDERGRVWVLECFEYPSKTPKGKAPRDRIVILEDTDGDGAADKRTVFAEGKDFPVPADRAKAGLGAFDIATGLEVGHGKVYLGAPPYLWTIDIGGENRDKPGKMTPILSGFGSQDTHETLNTFQWGPDGCLYGMQGIFTQSSVKPADGPETKMNAAVWRLDPATNKFEIFAEGTSNPWGLDWRNTDGEFILACCVIPHLHHIVPGGVYQRQAGQSYNPHAYGAIKEISDHTFHKESGWAHAGLISLDVPHMPTRFRNSVIFGSIHGNSLKHNILKPRGSSYTASRGDDFLQSGDKNFRPINLKWGPAGDIYLIDWHDQMPCHQARPDQWDYERGRVYRIQLKGTKTAKPADLGAKSLAELGSLAASPDPYTYRTALRLLAEHAKQAGETASMDAAVAGMARGLSPTGRVLVRAALGRASRDAVASLGSDAAGDKEVAEMPLTFRIIAQSGHATAATVRQFAKFAAVTPAAGRRELASAAIRLADTLDVTPLLHALAAHKADAADPLIPHLTWLAYEKVLAKPPADQPSAAVEKELTWLAAAAPGNPFVRDELLPRAVRRVASSAKPADLAVCVGLVAGLADADTRAAALGGLVAALDKQTVPPPAGWADLRVTLAATHDARLAKLADALAVTFRDPAALAKAMDVAADGSQGADARGEAVRRVAALKAPGGGELLARLAGGDGPGPVRVEAARGLAAFDPTAAAKALLPGWKGLPADVRAELVGVFAGRKESARELLTAMAAGTVGRGEVTDNTVIRMQAFHDPALDKLVETAWGRTRSTPADLLATIDKMRGELATGTASFARGKAVFAANCQKCHQFDGVGQSVGPALDGAARDIEYILANVIDPNRVIGAPYFLRTVNTLDGRVEQGLLHAEDDQSVTLKGENGVLKRISKDDIDGPVRVQEKSMMPEGLTYGMTAQDFRDLVRYLMASPYLTGGKAAPAGRIPVPAGPTTLTFAVTAAADVKTRLLLGVAGKYRVRLDGVEVAAGTGPTGDPDRVSVPVTLPAGRHTLTLTVEGPAGGVYARFLDPDRKLAEGE